MRFQTYIYLFTHVLIKCGLNVIDDLIARLPEIDICS